MTSDRFRECLALIGWGQRQFARLIDTDERQVRRWAAGAAIPEAVALWLDALARFHAHHPPPGKVGGEWWAAGK